ncbi:hypothetical protein [uncultured Cohaesibacter sp.]|uniref:hypothetical protein n=1 Tax=uncultured Cohaesibacter sp. TaxID=1002546 RepID=UPI0029C8F131|nr:hypothetical protein [uncultured Cohaesibacter sp.]
MKWQKEQRAFLTERAEKLDAVLSKRNLYVAGGTPLFRLVINEEARDLHRKLAEMHIWTRNFRLSRRLYALWHSHQ